MEAARETGVEMPVGLANKQYPPQPNRGKSEKTELGRQRQSYLTEEDKEISHIPEPTMCQVCAGQHTCIGTCHSRLRCGTET